MYGADGGNSEPDGGTSEPDEAADDAKWHGHSATEGNWPQNDAKSGSCGGQPCCTSQSQKNKH